MYPRAIIKKCLKERLNVVGICDHNASENVEYVMEAARGASIVVLPGMEITTKEEVHIIALFDTVDNLLSIQKFVYKSLSGMNREEIFGCQPIVNEKNEIEGFNEHLLIGATGHSLNETVEEIHFDALEVSFRTGTKKIREQHPELTRYAVIESSDAHFINDIGKGKTRFHMECPTIFELKLALEGREGRFFVTP